MYYLSYWCHKNVVYDTFSETFVSRFYSELRGGPWVIHRDHLSESKGPDAQGNRHFPWPHEKTPTTLLIYSIMDMFVNLVTNCVTFIICLHSISPLVLLTFGNTFLIDFYSIYSKQGRRVDYWARLGKFGRIVSSVKCQFIWSEGRSVSILI